MNAAFGARPLAAGGALSPPEHPHSRPSSSRAAAATCVRGEDVAVWRRRGSGAAPLPFFPPQLRRSTSTPGDTLFFFFPPMLEVDQMSESVFLPPPPPRARSGGATLDSFFFFFFFFKFLEPLGRPVVRLLLLHIGRPVLRVVLCLFLKIPEVDQISESPLFPFTLPHSDSLFFFFFWCASF